MNEILGQFLGFLGGTIMIATALPQVVRIRRLGNHEGMALSPWILMLGTYSAFTAYGLIGNSASIWVTNFLTFISTALVVTAVKGNSLKVWAIITAGGIASALLIIALPTVIANLVLVALTANRLPQLIKTWMNRHTAMVSAVSIPSLLIALSSMTCWLLYAILTEDTFITGNTVFAIAITLATALLEAHIARLAKQAQIVGQ